MSLKRLAVLKSERLKRFISLAIKDGWQVRLASGGDIQLKRKGWMAVYNTAFLIMNPHYKAGQPLPGNHCKNNNQV